uniref:Caspase recruitment domain-containing protein 19 n=1 Tax=Xenopus tropicalis TaxID=8364 RepID=A0A803K4P3_XENTR
MDRECCLVTREVLTPESHSHRGVNIPSFPESVRLQLAVVGLIFPAQGRSVQVEMQFHLKCPRVGAGQAGGGGAGRWAQTWEGQTDKEAWEVLLSEGSHPPGAGGHPDATMPDPLYSERLLQDTPYLTRIGRLSERVTDRIILQLNRVYPQILSNKEAERFRNPQTPLRTRLSDLLTHLHRKGDRECQEFYRALRNNADKVYATLPSRENLRPVFFLACFSAAAGLAFLLYCNSPETRSNGARKVFGYTALGFGRHIRNILISFLEEPMSEALPRVGP